MFCRGSWEYFCGMTCWDWLCICNLTSRALVAFWNALFSRHHGPYCFDARCAAYMHARHHTLAAWRAARIWHRQIAVRTWPDAFYQVPDSIWYLSRKNHTAARLYMLGILREMTAVRTTFSTTMIWSCCAGEQRWPFKNRSQAFPLILQSHCMAIIIIISKYLLQTAALPLTAEQSLLAISKPVNASCQHAPRHDFVK